MQHLTNPIHSLSLLSQFVFIVGLSATTSLASTPADTAHEQSQTRIDKIDQHRETIESIHDLLAGSSHHHIWGEEQPNCATIDNHKAYLKYLKLPESERKPIESLFALTPPSEGCVESTEYSIEVCYSTEAEYVKSLDILTYAEESWRYQIVELGFDKPWRLNLSTEDADDREEGIRIGFQDLPQGVGGATSPIGLPMELPAESPEKIACATTIVIASVLPIGDLVEDTVFHEIHHAVQMAMDCYETGNAYEATSTFLTLQALPNNKSTNNLVYGTAIEYQKFPNVPIGYYQQGTGFQYGASMFLQFVHENYADGDVSFLVDLWRHTRQTEHFNEPDLLDGVVKLAGESDRSYSDVLTDFGQWRYFMGDLALSDGSHFQKVLVGAEVYEEAVILLGDTPHQQAGGDGTVASHGYQYFRFEVGPNTPAGNLNFEFAIPDEHNWTIKGWAWKAGGELLDTVDAKIIGERRAGFDMHTSKFDGKDESLSIMLSYQNEEWDWDTHHQPDFVPYAVIYKFDATAIITSVTPLELEVGTETTVTLKGAGFSEDSELIFNSPHISVSDYERVDDIAIRCKVIVDNKATIGPLQLSLASTLGDNSIETPWEGPFQLIANTEIDSPSTLDTPPGEDPVAANTDDDNDTKESGVVSNDSSGGCSISGNSGLSSVMPLILLLGFVCLAWRRRI